jgi:membrane protein YdbS with pleckstrin-like domain
MKLLRVFVRNVLCSSCASGILIHVLGLQELQISPHFNKYLVIRKHNNSDSLELNSGLYPHPLKLG